jgi:hypothetical protein
LIMQFLSPIYLLGFLAIAAPILIHLIRRRKVTVVQWAAHRFLLSVTKKLQKRKRINDLILLLLRCLLFILLALLFARPFWAGDEEIAMEQSGTLVLLVDASASMDYSNGVRSRFDIAREQAEATLNALPASTAVALILFADRAYPVISPPTLDHHVVLQQLGREQPRPGRSNLAAGLSASLEVLANREEGSILLLSDGQATAWQDQVELMRLMQQAEEQSVRLQISNVAEGMEPVNLGITAFEATNTRAIVGQAIRLRVTVRNGGTVASKETRLVLEQAIGFPIEEAWVPALSPGEASQLELQITFTESGWQGLTARLPGDNLADDNSRSLGISVSEGLKVGVIEGPRNRGLNVDPGFFLSVAAVPVPAAQARNFPVQLSSLKLNEISRERLSDYNVILLAGVTSVNREQVDRLRGFVEAGGGLWVTPPSERAAAQQFILQSPLSALLPVEDLQVVEGRSSLPAGAPYDHAITGFWNESTAGSLASFFSDNYLEMTLTEGADSVLSLSNGNPLFAAKSLGAGRVFFSALPLDASWSEMPLSPQFVPFVQRTLQWLSGWVDAPAALAPGETWRVRVPSINVGRPFYAATPLTEGSTQLAGQVEFESGQAIIAYSDTHALGRYQLYLEPEAPAVGYFGVNLAAEESDLRPVQAQVLAELSGAELNATTDSSSNSSSIAQLFRALPDVWMLLVCLLLITGAAELTLAQRFSRTE